MSFNPGVSTTFKTQVASILGVQVVESHDKYLGMPAVVGKSKKQIFSALRDRIWKRINGWGERTLSSAGKEALIKTVLQSIPTYIMSCFSLPSYLVVSIESAIRAFWWGNGSNKKLAWVSWSKMCQPKNKGGLGFRDLRTFNLALLAKQCWRLLTHLGSILGKFFKAKYYPNSDFLEATLGARPSATWRSILKAKPFLEAGIRTRIGNGYSTAIWDSAWIPETGNFKVITPRPSNFYPCRVADLINLVTGTWDVGFIESVFWEVDRARIMAIPLGKVGADDRMVWHYSKDGMFSVRSCYHFIFESTSSLAAGPSGITSGDEPHRWRDIWCLPIPPKIRMFLWRACMGILPHKLELFRRHIIGNPFCESCGVKMESLAHVLLECRGMDGVWSSKPFNMQWVDSQATMWTIFKKLKDSLPTELFLTSLVVCWKVWEMRNLDLHGETRSFP